MNKIEVSRLMFMDILRIEALKTTTTNPLVILNCTANEGVKCIVVYEMNEEEFKQRGIDFGELNPILEKQMPYIKDCINILNTPPIQITERDVSGDEKVELFWNEVLEKQIREAKSVVEMFIESVKFHITVPEEVLDQGISDFWTVRQDDSGIQKT